MLLSSIFAGGKLHMEEDVEMESGPSMIQRPTPRRDLVLDDIDEDADDDDDTSNLEEDEEEAEAAAIMNIEAKLDKALSDVNQLCGGPSEDKLLATLASSAASTANRVSLASTLASDFAHLFDSKTPVSTAAGANRPDLDNAQPPAMKRTASSTASSGKRPPLPPPTFSKLLDFAESDLPAGPGGSGDSPNKNVLSNVPLTPPPTCPPPLPPPLMDELSFVDVSTDPSGQPPPIPSSTCAAPMPSTKNDNSFASDTSTASLLETFAAMARRRAAAGTTSASVATTNSVNNSRNQQTSGMLSNATSTKSSMSSFVRLALSSNFPTGLLHPTERGLSAGLVGGASSTGTSGGSDASTFEQRHQPNLTLSESEQVSVPFAAKKPPFFFKRPFFSKVSLEEFLESCRATSLLAELEDEDELAEGDDDDVDNDDDANDEDDDEDDDETFEHDGFETADAAVAVPTVPAASASVTAEGASEAKTTVAAPTPAPPTVVSSLRHRHAKVSSSGRRKAWDDEHVIKRKFSALIPAFDPRPGRTNVNQTSDLDIDPPNHADDAKPDPKIPSAGRDLKSPSSRLSLVMRGPNLPGIEDVDVDLTSLSEWTVFRAVQSIIQQSNLGNKADKIRRVWEPTYSIIYGESEKEATPVSVRSDSDSVLPQVPLLTQSHCSMDQVLQLLRQLYILGSNEEDEATMFNSKKITNKLVQQIQDPLVLAADALPDWCQELTFSCPMLFPFETRLLHFHCTAFGASRSIVWLQNQRDQNAERSRGGLMGVSSRLGLGRDDFHEFRVGRIKHERVKVPRGEAILDWAMQVMKVHAERKAILEVEFKDEEGTGLGPTLEFFALVAAELQRKDLAMWVCEDDEEGVDVLGPAEEGRKPPGYYVRRACGLFPAPLAQNSSLCTKVSRMFWFLGVFLAKTLQDNRLVDLPLSKPFLKFLCQGEISSVVRQHANIHSHHSDEDLMTSSTLSVLSEESDLDLLSAGTSSWYQHMLCPEDLADIDPARGEFVNQLSELISQKQVLLASLENESDEVKAKAVSELKLELKGSVVALEDLQLTFQYSPSSKVFGADAVVDLVPNGEDDIVSINNVDDYVHLLLDFVLDKGIRRQMDAFRSGFNLVFPMERLGSFNPEEVRTMLCGDQCPVFTREDIIRYTEPKLGYTRESAAFQKFVNVLVNFSGSERKAFLQFTTGCSSLPPGKTGPSFVRLRSSFCFLAGGLANLSPRLTIVRKIDAGDGSYPSVNTCVHYLKLPDYSTEEVMKERLLMATREKGFHLN